MAAGLVALHLPPAIDYLAAVEGVWGRGDAVLPLPWHGSPDVVKQLVEELRPGAIVDVEGRRRVTSPRPRPVAAGTALVVATSGSAGQPKGVELTHSALEAAIVASVDRLGAGRGERWLCCLPLHHIAGLSVLLRARHLGTQAIVHDGFDVAAVASTPANWVSLVPTQLRRLLAAGTDLTGYHGVLLGGGRVTADLRETATARGVPVVESYGMTETCGGCVYDGRPLDGVEVALDPRAPGRQVGRVRLRGPMLMRGYRGRPDLTARAFEDGWLVTADLGRLSDGRLEVVGRADDIIVTGGENVAADAVAAVLTTAPHVADAAVVGRADEEWGEIVVAVVVPRRAGAPPTLESLRAAGRDRLAPAALPRAVHVVEAIPRDGLGKVPRAWLERAARRAVP